MLILEVEEGQHGLWYVTSPDPRGLLVVGKSRQEALEKVDGALRDMAQAVAQHADNREDATCHARYFQSLK